MCGTWSTITDRVLLMAGRGPEYCVNGVLEKSWLHRFFRAETAGTGEDNWGTVHGSIVSSKNSVLFYTLYTLFKVLLHKMHV